MTALLLAVTGVGMLPGMNSPDPSRQQVDGEARALYLRGRFFLTVRTEEGLRRGIEYFHEATKRAPRFAAAWAGLADGYAMLGHFGMSPPSDAHTNAKRAVQRALNLDPNSAEAHTSLGYLQHRFEWDWARAEKSFRRAIASDPEYALAHHWYSIYLLTTGRRSEALDAARRAEELDPLNPVTAKNLSDLLLIENRADQALARSRLTLEMDPNLWLAHSSLASALQIHGDYARALDEREQAVELANRGTFQLTSLGVEYARSGNATAARRILAEIDQLDAHRYVAAYARVPILALLQDHEAAFTWLDRAFAERSSQMVFLGTSSNLSSMRADPRFGQIMARVGLP
jgi:tetratricopeptide (TPR) repeat protein